MDLDVEMVRLATGQHSLVALEQVRALGFDRAAIARRARGPMWDRVSRRVLRLAGSVATPEQRWLAAVLDAGPGAVLSHRTAAALFGLPGFDPLPVHVTRPRRRSRRPSELAVAHEPLRLWPHHVTAARQVPVVTPALMLLQLAGTVPKGRSERALDNALSRKLTRLDDVRSLAAELGGHGVPGSAWMWRMLAERDDGYVAPESGLEARGIAWLDDAGFPPLDRQVVLGGPDGVIGRVDGLFRDVPVIVEIDSDRHHTSLLDRAADGRRDAAFRAIGYEVVRIRENEVDERDPAAIERLIVARARAGRRRPAA